MDEPILFSEFCDMWLDRWAKVRLKHTGLAEYRGIIGNHLTPAFGGVPVTEVTTAEIQRYVADTVAGGLSPRTVANHVKLLRRMFDVALEWNLVDRNAAAEVALPRQVRPERSYLTPDEMRRLIEATPRSWRVLIASACLLGARRGELLALSWKSVSLEDRTVRFERSMRRGVISDVKSPSSKAAVPIPESLIRLLEARKAVAPDPEGLVFCRSDGSPLHDSKPNAVLKAALIKAGLPHVSFHSLRRSWVMAHIEAGTPVKTIVSLGRWKSAQTFLDEYAVYLPVAGGDAASVVDRLIQGANTDS